MTGIASFRTEITPKRLALLRQLLPGLRRILVFYNPRAFADVMDITRQAAIELGIEIVERSVTSRAEIDRVLELAAGDADAFFFPNDGLVLRDTRRIVERANALGLPTMAQNIEAVRLGALAGYGLGYRDEGLLAARYVAQILAGARPGDMPVAVNERHVFGINLRTAKAIRT